MQKFVRETRYSPKGSKQLLKFLLEKGQFAESPPDRVVALFET
jgi:hypothetical protein